MLNYIHANGFLFFKTSISDPYCGNLNPIFFIYKICSNYIHTNGLFRGYHPC